MKILTKATEKRLFGQHVGTGYLVLKTAAQEFMQAEVFLRPRDGVLCRITDGKPALPVELTYEDEQ